jgi:hypothetical protein
MGQPSMAGLRHDLIGSDAAAKWTSDNVFAMH